MNRRSFCALAVGSTIAVVLAEPVAGGQIDDLDFTTMVYAPNVVSAYSVTFSNIKEEVLFIEPLLLSFIAYEFASDDDAIEAMSVIKDGILHNYEKLVDSPEKTAADKRVKEASIGRIGDDRFAFANTPTDYAGSSWSGIRLKNQILTVLSIGLASDQLGFVAEFLESYISGIDVEERSILPELADMPIGWEAGPDPLDVTDDVSTPVATPSG